MPLPDVERLLCSGIRMLSLGHAQKWFLGLIKFVKLFVKSTHYLYDTSTDHMINWE